VAEYEGNRVEAAPEPVLEEEEVDASVYTHPRWVEELE
jgi:hypothetical protein